MANSQEPGRLIVSLALLAISLALIIVGHIPEAVGLASGVAALWGIHIIRNNRRGGPPSPS